MGKVGLPFVLVEDCADAIARALDLPASAGRTYNLVGDVNLSAREYVGELARRSGRNIRFHPQPLWLFQAIEIFKWVVKKATRRPGVNFPSFRDLKSRSCARPFDNSRAKRELGWSPVSDRERFIERAIGHFVRAQEVRGGEAAVGSWGPSPESGENEPAEPVEAGRS